MYVCIKTAYVFCNLGIHIIYSTMFYNTISLSLTSKRSSKNPHAKISCILTRPGLLQTIHLKFIRTTTLPVRRGSRKKKNFLTAVHT